MNAKSADFLKRNCKIAWDRILSKYAPHAALSLLKLKNEFNNSKLELIEKKPDEWILNSEQLKIQMKKIRQKGCIPDKDFMIHVLNNLLEEYDVILDWLKKKHHVKLGQST